MTIPSVGAAMVWIFLCPLQTVEILTPNVMALEDGVFDRWLSLEGGSLTNETGALMKKTPESSLALFAMRSLNLEEGPY